MEKAGSDTIWPECEKLKATAPYSQKIGEFIDWLHDDDVVLAEWVKDPQGFDENLIPVTKPIQELLAEFFEIDMNKVEEERRQILESIS